MAIMGRTTEDMLRVIGVSSKTTLYKHYREEIETGGEIATALVAGQLFDLTQQTEDLKVKASSCMFWMKTRAGWRERSEIDHTSSDGSMTPPREVRVVAADVTK